MIYKDINSSVFLQFDTSTRFPINRGVRQGCGISPFLFLLVVELLSLNIRNNPDVKGLSIFNREIRISQLADDTTLFLENNSLLFKFFWKNKHQHLNKHVICGKKSDGGFDMFDFFLR